MVTCKVRTLCPGEEGILVEWAGYAVPLLNGKTALSLLSFMYENNLDKAFAKTRVRLLKISMLSQLGGLIDKLSLTTTQHPHHALMS